MSKRALKFQHSPHTPPVGGAFGTVTQALIDLGGLLWPQKAVWKAPLAMLRIPSENNLNSSAAMMKKFHVYSLHKAERQINKYNYSVIQTKWG